MIDPLSVFLLLLGAATPILFAALGELVVERDRVQFVQVRTDPRR